VVKVKDVIRLLEEDDWFLARTRGSHRSIQALRQVWYRYSCRQGEYRCPSRNSQQYLEISWLEAGARIREMKYAVIVEEGENSFGAHTRKEVLELIQEAIEFHIEGLRADGQPIPEPSSSVEYVEVRAA
jgi:predicted RNase H-like HicB family nuclease